MGSIDNVNRLGIDESIPTETKLSETEYNAGISAFNDSIVSMQDQLGTLTQENDNLVQGCMGRASFCNAIQEANNNAQQWMDRVNNDLVNTFILLCNHENIVIGIDEEFGRTN